MTNKEISDELIDIIGDKDNKTFGNVLQEILKSDIKIYVNKNRILTIKPYWIELYYYNNKINC